MSRPLEGRDIPIKTKPGRKADLPQDLEAVVFYCSNCGGKHTYGSDYFVEVGVPATCPNCGDPFDQDDQVHRYKDETPDDLLMKRDALRRKRGESVPVSEKPEDGEAIKAQRIRDLEQEIAKLKGDQVTGIRLGP